MTSDSNALHPHALGFVWGQEDKGGKVRLAAKRVPDAVERWLRMYESERHEGEEQGSGPLLGPAELHALRSKNEWLGKKKLARLDLSGPCRC